MNYGIIKSLYNLFIFEDTTNILNRHKTAPHLPCAIEMVSSLTEIASGFADEDDDVLVIRRLTTKAGWVGSGRVLASVPSIITMVTMEGRSLGSSWTHNSPMFMHLITSDSSHDSNDVGSIKSRALLSNHNLHAWINTQCSFNKSTHWEKSI